FSDDGRLVVTASADGTARVWDVARGEAVSGALEHGATVRHAAFGRNGLLVTARDDRTARLWDVATGGAGSPPPRHKDAVLHASFSADGRRLVTAGADGTARIWDCSPDDHLGDELGDLVRFLAARGHEGPEGVRQLTAAEAVETWQRLRQRHRTGLTA